MKNALIVLLLVAVCAISQTRVPTITPVGGGLTYSPGVTVNNTTAVSTLYADTLQAGYFATGRKYDYTLYCSLTTPLSILPTLTITLYIGGGSMVLTNSALLSASLTKRPFSIHVVCFANSPTSQFMYAEMQTDGGTLTLGSNYIAKSAAMSQDLSGQIIMKATAQFSALSANTTFFVDNVYKEPF